MNTYICRYCRQPSDPNAPTCPLCGAPVDIRSVVSESGWVEQPPIRDMARLQCGQSHVQIAGTTVPVAEFNLAPEDWIYFSHHVLLWTEPRARLVNMPMRGGWNRKMAGLPLVMVEVRGQNSDDREMHYPMGRYGDVFGAQGAPGLLLLHAPGNVFIRDLRQGETLLIQPSSLLYRDVTVRQTLHLEYPRNMGLSFWRSSWSYRTIWVRLWGPGRVAVQSVYEPPEDTETIRRHSYATTHHW